MTSDLLTSAESWSEFVGRFRTWRANLARRRPGFSEMVAEHQLVLNRNPLSGQRSDRALVVSVVAALTDDETKDRVALVTRAMALSGDAFGAIFSAEAWVAEETFTEGGERVMPSDNPARREVVVAVAEHRWFPPSVHFSPIERVKRRRRIGQWQRMGGDDVAMGGRFGDVLKVTAAGLHPAAVAAAQRFLIGEIEAGRMSDLKMIDADEAFAN